MLHGEFHDLVLEAIEAPRLRALNATTKPQADRYRRIYSSGDFGQQIRSVKEHTGIIEAIADGNGGRGPLPHSGSLDGSRRPALRNHRGPGRTG